VRISFESVSIYEQRNSSAADLVSATPFQQDTTYHVGLQYALNNPTFANAYFTADDSGYFGDPAWLPSVGYQLGDPVNPLTASSISTRLTSHFPVPFR